MSEREIIVDGAESHDSRWHPTPLQINLPPYNERALFNYVWVAYKYM